MEGAINKSMNTSIIILCISLLVFTGCNTNTASKADGGKVPKKENAEMKSDKAGSSVVDSSLSISDFDFLKLEMKYDDVVKKVGEPSRTTGSGILMYVYDLKDGSYIILNFGPKRDALKVVRLVKKDGTYEDILKN